MRKTVLILLITSVLSVVMNCAIGEDSSVLNLPASLITIDEQAFYQATSLDVVVVPDGTKIIESKAFAYSSLHEISLPRSLTSIADDAFEGCQQFKVNVPMNSYAYNWCMDHGYISKPSPTASEYFTYATINGLYARITGYTGTDTVVVIPEEIDDYIISEISNNTFKNNKDIEYVFVPSTVTKIGASVFFGCTNLIGVDVGENVESIGNSAFYGCTSLIAVEFPNSLKTTGSSLFENCVNLAFFDYPISWESAGSKTIAGCTKINELIIPEGPTIIPQDAFMSCKNITSISISSTIEKIGVNSFKNCSGLTEITIPGNVKEVGGFANCSNLQSVILSDGVTIISNNAFDNCTMLSSIFFSSALTYIGNFAFYNCSQVTDFNLPTGITQIGVGAFRKCSGITQLNLPDTVTTIGCKAFADCTNLSSFHYPISWSTVSRDTSSFGEYYDFGNHFENCVKLRRIEVPEGVETIVSHAFANAKYVRNIILPSTIKKFGNWSFYNCEAITNIEIPYGLTTVGVGAFRRCSNLEQLNLPDTVTTIGCKAFADCMNLSSFHYPIGWSTVSRDTSSFGEYYDFGNHFENCVKLQRIEVPEGVETIVSHAFANAKYVRNIILPSTIKEFGNWSFYNCEAITSIEIPYGLTIVGVGAFRRCSNLEQLNLPDTVTTIGCKAFADCTNLSSFHYPIGWSTVSRDTSSFGEYYSFGNHFENCTSLKNINIPHGVSRIPSYAFCGSSALIEVFAPESLTALGENAFANCPVFEKVYLGLNVTSLENNVFKDCPELTIWCEYGSTVLQYCLDNDIPYYYLSLTGSITPSGSLYKGDSFSIYGHVRSNISIDRVTVIIKDSSSGSTLRTSSITPGSLDCNLNTAIDNPIDFSSLDLGHYLFTISADTQSSSEIFVEKSFSIVPPPLRLTRSLSSVPTGEITQGSIFTYSGVIESNYLIDQATFSILDFSGNVKATISTAPNAMSLNISMSSSLSIQSLSAGTYKYRISVHSNNETKVAHESSFTIINAETTAASISALDLVFISGSYREVSGLRSQSMSMAQAAYNLSSAKSQLQSLGFNNCKPYNESSGTDTCGHLLGWRILTDADGSKYCLFAVICRGTNGTANEWLSNFNFVSSNQFHSSFYAAASNVTNNFTSYVSTYRSAIEEELGHELSIADSRVWVTGHSRGAGVANILGGRFLPSTGFSNNHIFCYTFACPNVYLGTLSHGNNIHNYNIGGDLVARVPFAEWGYQRYGITHTVQNGEYVAGYSVIDNKTMDTVSHALSSMSSEMQIRFAQALQDELGSAANWTTVCHILAKFLIKEFTDISIERIVEWRALVETYNFVGATHQTETYVDWINELALTGGDGSFGGGGTWGSR